MTKLFERVGVLSKRVTKSFERVGVLSERVTKSFEWTQSFSNSCKWNPGKKRKVVRVCFPVHGHNSSCHMTMRYSLLKRLQVLQLFSFCKCPSFALSCVYFQNISFLCLVCSRKYRCTCPYFLVYKSRI